MIKPEQIPPDARYAAWKAMKAGMTTNDALAAAINAWPGVERIYRSEDEKLFTVILHFTQENTDV